MTPRSLPALFAPLLILGCEPLECTGPDCGGPECKPAVMSACAFGRSYPDGAAMIGAWSGARDNVALAELPPFDQPTVCSTAVVGFVDDASCSLPEVIRVIIGTDPLAGTWHEHSRASLLEWPAESGIREYHIMAGSAFSAGEPVYVGASIPLGSCAPIMQACEGATASQATGLGVTLLKPVEVQGCPAPTSWYLGLANCRAAD